MADPCTWTALTLWTVLGLNMVSLVLNSLATWQYRRRDTRLSKERHDG